MRLSQIKPALGSPQPPINLSSNKQKKLIIIKESHSFFVRREGKIDLWMCVFNINPQCQRCVISWDSRGAYRMMSLLPQSNCSISHPLLLNAGKQSCICMPHMLPGGSVGCRYKLDFLTTRCKRGRKSGRSRLWQSFLDQALCPISLAARQTHLTLCCCRKSMCYGTFESFFNL